MVASSEPGAKIAVDAAAVDEAVSVGGSRKAMRTLEPVLSPQSPRVRVESVRGNGCGKKDGQKAGDNVCECCFVCVKVRQQNKLLIRETWELSQRCKQLINAALGPEALDVLGEESLLTQTLAFSLY